MIRSNSSKNVGQELIESKASAIRRLASSGLKRKVIAERLGISVGHVHSSLARDRAEGRVPRVGRQLQSGETIGLLTVSDDGSVTLPASCLERLGIAAGQDVVVATLISEIRIMSLSESLAKLVTR